MPETKQPVWKIVFNDDSLIVYVDETGVYCPEAVAIVPGKGKHRFLCEYLKLSPQGKLIPAGWNSGWKYSYEMYTVWFDAYLPNIARFGGVGVAELRQMFCSVDPVLLARAYNLVGAYKGYENL